ncbi:MAG TPA: hypothetical protein VLH08_01855, partial [Acidobacteriota bacterium]|nr:hypothetical protein [Acidobacteriota bacterium]
MKRLLIDNRLWFLLIFFVGLICFSRHGVSNQPVHGDNAFLLYMQRVVLAGEPLYQTTVFDYPPLGPIVGAFAMKIGNAFSIPFYLAPRYLCLIIASLTAAFIMLLVQKSTGNLWAGVFGGIVVSSLQLLGVLACTNLDPKVLLAFFMTLAALGIAYDRWWLAGMGSVLATCCWQPALIVPLAAFIVLLFNRDSLRFRSFLLGIFLGSLPLVIYFLIYGGVKEFFYQGIVNQAMRSAGGSTGHFHLFGWAGSLWRLLSAERIFVSMAAAGFLFFLIYSIRKDVKGHWMNQLTGGIPVFTVLWICFSSLHFQGWNDAAPFFPLIG